MLFTPLIPLSIIALSLWIFQLVTAKIYQLQKNQKDKIFEKSKNNKINEKPLISVIVPYYNENESSLIDTINSIYNNYSNLEIILINDGSQKKYSRKLIEILNKCNCLHIQYNENQGKRFAMVQGIQRANAEYIVFVDSDTILSPNAIENILQEMIVNDVDAVGGNIVLKNKDENKLTKIISGMYWTAFNLERLSQSAFKCMTCCSGGFSIYKSKIIKENISEFFNQYVGKIKCTAGDDRHLTSIFIINKHKSIVSSNAIAYTDTPSSFKSFIKQQQRWARSLITEIIWSLASFDRFKKFPKIYHLFIFKILFKYIYMMYIFLLLIFSAFTFPINYLYLISFSIGFLSIVTLKSIVSLFFPKSSLNNSLNLFLFGILGFFVMSPFLMWSTITPFKSIWGSRSQ